MKRYLSLIAVVLAALLVLAACGGDDTEDTTTTEGAVDTTTTEAMEETTTTEAMEETTTTEAMEETTTTEAMEETNTIADIVAGDENFSTLLAAVDAAGLVDALSDPDATLTVFAPTNDAFEAALTALGMTADELLASPDLEAILLYHVLGEVVTSADIIGAGTEQVEVTTLEGSMLIVTISDGGEVFVGEGDPRAQVTQADIEADNGVIHVIDGVLLPPSSDV